MSADQPNTDGFTDDKELTDKIMSDKFALTPEERQKLQDLLDWQNRSAESLLKFGPSVTCLNCHTMNNPNNEFCYNCWRKL